MGQIDIPLNRTGIEQAQTVAQTMADLNIAHIFAGPLTRTKQTAEIIATATNCPITFINELKQPSIGIAEGKHKKEVNPLIAEWAKGGFVEGAEPWKDFVARVADGLKLVLTDNYEKKPILLISHGPTYWALLEILNAKAEDNSAKNCVVYSFNPPENDANQWQVSVHE